MFRILVGLCLASVTSICFAAPATRPVDATSIEGKVLCGYQGWFSYPDDGSHRGFAHWARRANEPLEDGNVGVDVWPDLREFSAAELHDTGLKFADGRMARVFSSANRATVMRHFRWMRDYGIDGVFIQRFGTELRAPRSAQHVNTVLDNCRIAARATGRVYSVMYDLSGLRAGETKAVLDDWHALRTTAHVTDDPTYLHHRGKPLVTVWGIGFNDNRAYTLAECRDLVEALKRDGCSVMVGVPTYWCRQEANRDVVDDPALHDLIEQADIVSPWTVGRYNSPDAAGGYAQRTMAADVAWCADHHVDYLPVVFPGFSWHNLRDGNAPTDQIPRLGGQFLWSQFVNVHDAGLHAAYVAMFDEMDEGTAIFKLASDVPVGQQSKFVSMNGVPSDQYLWLAGEGGRLLRGERDAAFPTTRPDSR